MFLPNGTSEVFSSVEVRFIWAYRVLIVASDRLSVWCELQKAWSFHQYGDEALVPDELPDVEKAFVSLDEAFLYRRSATPAAIRMPGFPICFLPKWSFSKGSAPVLHIHEGVFLYALYRSCYR